jgi:hypothetical protein
MTRRGWVIVMAAMEVRIGHPGEPTWATVEYCTD